MSSATTNQPITFLYLAATPVGGRKLGLRAATNESTLNESLRRDRLLLLRSWRAPRWAVATRPGAEMSLKDQAGLNEQLATLLSRGVPVTEALEVAASVVTGPGKAKALKMRELVGAGASFSGACEQVGGFDPVAIAVYRAAERTGDLGGACARIASSARRRLAITAKAVTLMIYPAVVMTIGFVVTTVMLMWVVPQIGAALADAGMKLPWFSELVIGLGRWLRSHALGALVAFVLFAVAVFMGRRVLGAMLLAGARLLPTFRRLQLAIEAARFFAVMGALTRTGVPVADALGVAARTVSEPTLRTQLESMRRKLVEGALFRNLLEEADALPLATRRLLIAAERAGDLDTVFETLSSDMADEVDRRSDRLLALLEPLLIVLMFLVIGTLLIAVMIPLISISQGIGGGM